MSQKNTVLKKEEGYFNRGTSYLKSRANSIKRPTDEAQEDEDNELEMFA